MGTKNNPGKFDCYGNAELDEPVFILLARDVSAPILVRNWAMMRQMAIGLGVKPQSDMKMVAEAEECAAAMEAWRKKNRPNIPSSQPRRGEEE